MVDFLMADQTRYEYVPGFRPFQILLLSHKAARKNILALQLLYCL